ncbi:MAG TPA: sugar phosphate isomerase/epimerase family protein [Rhizomicrobium sp.]|nr:sugar phosphate isomerase/epimerase family protein [Rhizomicrobium sp.]
MTAVIGFMQGRLCDRVDGKIQAFPWADWEKEFPAAQALGIPAMEWTLDRDRLFENPLMTEVGRARIAELSRQHRVKVTSLTGDLFMQAPFWKAEGAARAKLLTELDQLIDACARAGIGFIVVPLVDAGGMADKAQEDLVVAELTARADMLRARGVKIVFECDYPPAQLAAFIARLPADVFGINYDIGNSASLGYDSAEEIAAYGDRILNVHIKDRVLGGTTVPLGTGNATLAETLGRIVRSGYRGIYILQTARAAENNHAEVLRKYRDMSAGWIAEAGG